jgi:cytochrome c
MKRGCNGEAVTSRKTVRLMCSNGLRFALGIASLALLPSWVTAADAERGRRLFEQCAACHVLTQGEQELGPHLKGLFGRKAGSLEDFRYSPAMRRSTLVWDRANLDRFIADPQGELRGTRMPYSGMPDPADREDLLDFLERATK